MVELGYKQMYIDIKLKNGKRSKKDRANWEKATKEAKKSALDCSAI